MTARAPRNRTLLLLTSLLRGGGAERVVATLANAWSRQGYRVVILVLRDLDGSEYTTDPSVEVRALGIIGETNPWWQPSVLRQLYNLRSTMAKWGETLSISFETKLNITVNLLAVGLPVQLICTEHVVPRDAGLNWVWRALRRIAFAGPGHWVAPTRAIAGEFRRLGRHCEVLPYPGSYHRVDASLALGSRPCKFVAAGRLAFVKGFDRLIEAFAKVCDKLPSWTLEIAGEGEERASLAALIQKLGLAERVHLVGRVANVPAFFASGRVAVVSSRSEAYPMVVLEAMSVGTPLVVVPSTESLFEMAGPHVLWSKGGSIEKLAHALLQSAQDQELVGRLAFDAVSVATAHLADRVAARWSESLEELAS